MVIAIEERCVNRFVWVLQVVLAHPPLAAIGLALVMLGAVVWHAGRGEVRNVVMNLVFIGLLALVAVVRGRVHPVAERG